MKRLHSIPAALGAVSSLLIVLAFAGAPALAQEHGPAAAARESARAADIARDPADVPPPVGNRAAATVKVDLVATEVTGVLDPSTGATYHYWTFNGKVPGPMIRVRQGDDIEVTLHNDPSSHMVHSVDFHAAIGPGGGAAVSQVMPGRAKTFTFQATTPGLFVYHCGTPMIGDHIANGMYGLILVEPPGGLARVDREYYVMQGEIYTAAPMGKGGLQTFSEAKLLQETPEYFVFNGAVGALTKTHPLQAKAGETVRIFFGDAGPNATSSLHMVGEIFTHEYALGSLISPPIDGVQTASVPAGGAAMLELKAETAGQFNFMDHAMARMARGLVGTLNVSGAENASLMHAGPAPQTSAQALSGITESDMREAQAMASRHALQPAAAEPDNSGAVGSMNMGDMDMGSMKMGAPAPPAAAKAGRTPPPTTRARTTNALNGCLTLESDGKVMIRLLGSQKIYRLEARPLLFDANDRHIVHVTGYFGSVMASEDPRIPSFVVDTLDMVAPDCSAKVTAADLRKVEAKYEVGAGAGAAIVGMDGMRFTRTNIVVNVGQQVVWKNTSSTIHNVVADPAKANVAADVHVPAGAHTFASELLQPGQTFAHTFTVPGVYKYVCTLHEANGMMGVVFVKASAAVKMASTARQDSDSSGRH